jgi:hypothetical protein
MARLNIARSRRRPSSWRRTRMVQTSFGFNGRFRPISLPFFQGTVCRDGAGISVLMVVSEAGPFPVSAGSPSIGSIPYAKRARSRRNPLFRGWRVCNALESAWDLDRGRT